MVTGLQPVREAIRVHRSALKRVALEEKDSPTLEALGRFAADQGVPEVVRVPRTELDRWTDGGQHQGVSAWAPELTLLPGKMVYEVRPKGATSAGDADGYGQLVWTNMPAISLEVLEMANPMLVLGAMYARLAERVMKVPALAAFAPDGPTQTIVGILECRASLSMLSIDDSEPPRVSSWMITAAAPAFSACRTAPVT